MHRTCYSCVFLILLRKSDVKTIQIWCYWLFFALDRYRIRRHPNRFRHSSFYFSFLPSLLLFLFFFFVFRARLLERATIPTIVERYARSHVRVVAVCSFAAAAIAFCRPRRHHCRPRNTISSKLAYAIGADNKILHIITIASDFTMPLSTTNY